MSNQFVPQVKYVSVKIVLIHILHPKNQHNPEKQEK